MPELPEVEVLVRHLRPQLQGQTIRAVLVRRERVIAGTSIRQFTQALQGAKFTALSRRGKYLLFSLLPAKKSKPRILYGHLGMTGRMYLRTARTALPKHAAVVLDLGRKNFVFEDTRYFGRLTLEPGGIEKLGPEPLDSELAPENFAEALKCSSQPIKVRLLDQSLVAGVGNIYASEALFGAGISPKIAARRLTFQQVERLYHGIRAALSEAIECGSTVPLDYPGTNARDHLFYF